MKATLRLLLVFLLPGCLLPVMGCGPSDEARLLAGEWHGVAWTANDGTSPAHDAAGTRFRFLPGGRYTYIYSDLVEEGEWSLSGKELYTTPDGGTKMMVRIVRIDTDTLVFAMNRGGTPEMLTLARAR